ncbi:hypothetical protein FOZ62_006254, partial [Perkinsus olseni]
GSTESWARNPTFIVQFPPDSSGTTDIMVTFTQLPTRGCPGERLEELFVCLMRLDSPEQPLERFEKDRIHRGGGMSRLRRGRHVAFHALEVPASGCYAVVPSTWSTGVSIEYQITIMCLPDHPCAEIVPDVRPLRNFVPATRVAGGRTQGPRGLPRTSAADAKHPARQRACLLDHASELSR